jgi:hypothetical protein
LPDWFVASSKRLVIKDSVGSRLRVRVQGHRSARPARAAYDALREEFALASALIKAEAMPT